jgi:hypothetical protein
MIRKIRKKTPANFRSALEIFIRPPDHFPKNRLLLEQASFGIFGEETKSLKAQTKFY